jgi:Xaa-Pro dipeptidase
MRPDGQPAPRRFTREEYGRRLALVRAAMSERGLNVLLVVGAENVHYLSGLDAQTFFVPTALLVTATGSPVLVARAMEGPTVTDQTVGCDFAPYPDQEEPAAALPRVLRTVSGRHDRIGVPRDLMALPPNVWDALRAALPDREFSDGAGIVEAVRSIRSPAEVSCIRAAAATSTAGMRAAIAAAADGASEREVAAEAYRALILAGSEYPGFVPLVRSRQRLMQEHVTWSDRRLAKQDALFLELSGCVARYHAPLARMVYIGSAPSGSERAAQIAQAGLESIRAALTAGATASGVYQTWQQTMNSELGHDRYRRHHCGYLVGLGFPPSWVGGSRVVGLRPGNDMVLREGMTFHAFSWLLGQPPADYVLSDTMLVTPDGAEILTDAPREPIVIEN